MLQLLRRSLGLITCGLSLLALVPLSGVVSAQLPRSRSGFLPFQPNGALRPNQQVIFGGNNGNNGGNNNGGNQGNGGGGNINGGGNQGNGGGGNINGFGG